MVHIFRWFGSFPVIQVMASNRHVKSCFPYLLEELRCEIKTQTIPLKEANMLVATQYRVQCWHQNIKTGFVKNKRKQYRIISPQTIRHRARYQINLALPCFFILLLGIPIWSCLFYFKNKNKMSINIVVLLEFIYSFCYMQFFSKVFISIPVKLCLGLFCICFILINRNWGMGISLK